MTKSETQNQWQKFFSHSYPQRHLTSQPIPCTVLMRSKNSETGGTQEPHANKPWQTSKDATLQLFLSSFNNTGNVCESHWRTACEKYKSHFFGCCCCYYSKQQQFQCKLQVTANFFFFNSLKSRLGVINPKSHPKIVMCLQCNSKSQTNRTHFLSHSLAASSLLGHVDAMWGGGTYPLFEYLMHPIVVTVELYTHCSSANPHFPQNQFQKHFLGLLLYILRGKNTSTMYTRGTNLLPSPVLLLV